jgi:Flp pilus assembly protein TadG
MMKPKDVLVRGAEYLSGFMRDTRGNVAILFALCAFPFIGLVGAAVDYSMASDLRARLQRATDATGLQLCLLQGQQTSADFYNSAKNVLLPSYLGSQTFEITMFEANLSPRQIRLVTAAHYDTAIIRIMGPSFSTLTVTADAQCQSQEQGFEIALVLDTTGSMANSSGSKSKMDAAKDAATTFVKYMFTNGGQSGQVRIALVPFAASVAVDPTTYRYATWIDQAGGSKYHWTNVAGALAEGFKNRFDVFAKLKAVNADWGWAGCLESLGYPRNVQDGAPTPADPNSYYVPLFAPDEAGNTLWFGQDMSSYNSYMDDGPYLDFACFDFAPLEKRFTQACKYRKTLTSVRADQGGPNWQCTSRPLTRLTTNQTTLLNEISALQPSGSTNIHQGFVWGWQAISPVGVFADSVPYANPNTTKVIVLMTDGANQWLTDSSKPLTMSRYSAYGYLLNGDGTNASSRLPPTYSNPAADSDTRSAIDALTLEACRNAAAKNIVIYTIGFSTPMDKIDPQGLALLSNCAGSKDRFFEANDATELMKAFAQIQKGISGLKLTR